QLVPLENDHVAVFLRDIAERKESEEVINRLVGEVEQQARLLDEILSATPDAFILFDRIGRYLYVNRKGLENSGLSSDLTIGKTWRELGFPEDSGLIFEKRLEQVFATGESVTYEEQFPTLNGLRDFLTTLTPIHDPEGNVIFMLNTIHDITERKQAEVEQQKLAAELEQQARVFDEVLSTTPDSFLMIDREGRFAYSSPSALSNASLSAKQVVGKTWSELGFPEEMGAQSDQRVAEVFASGQATTVEMPFPTAQGFRDFESIFSPVHDKDGQVVAVVITNRDITERKQIEEALRENQRLLTSINETALAGIAVVDVNGDYVQVNSTYCDIYGYPAAEMIGKHFTMILPPELREDGVIAHLRIINGEGTNTVRHWEVTRKDGTEREVISYNSLLVRENGERFRVVVILDVSEQRAAQRALEASEKRLNSILNSMEDAVWSVHAEKRELLYCNPALETILGYSAEEFRANPSLLTDVVHPEDLDYFNVTRLRALEEQSIDLEYRIVRRDGAVRWVHNRFWIVRNAPDTRVDGIMTDITDRRQASDQAMQLTIERERVRILSDFVRDASHEFRTPLSVINTRLYLMEKIGDPKRHVEYIDGIKEQADRILKLVESLITMSRLDSITRMSLERLDLNRVIVLMNVSSQATASRTGITFALDLSPEPLIIQGEINELITALNAIFDNAFSYTPRGGRIDVRSYRLNHQEIVVEVRDNGLGMNADVLPHIFERFYRVDRARSIHGFGLGLPIARKIVEMHRGRIEVESVPDEGSVFRLVFPTDTRPQ
ncbi:MAG: PAS domain S-box protein, partial [Chloroflexota bacterium]